MKRALQFLSPILPAGLVVLAVIILIMPFFFPSGFYFRIGALIFINAFAVVGLVILIGYAGQISLGHAGFLGIGAYSVALAPVYIGLPPSLSLFFGAGLTGIIAWIIGRPILKLKGHYLAVATLGFGILVFLFLSNEDQITGGPDGITVAALGIKPALAAMGIKAKTSVIWYFFTGFILLIGAWTAINLRNSPTGRALRSLHDSEIAAKTIGVDVARYKLIAFTISAVYASIAGSMLALMNKFVTPDVAGFIYSIELITMTVLGGATSVLGGILGAAVLTILPQALTFFHDYEHLVLGLIMMLIMIFMRDGLLPSLMAQIRRKAK